MKVLYFHHGDRLGGAPLSLLYIIEALDRSRFQPVICCLKDGEVAGYYRERGLEVLIRPDITTLGHVNGGWYPLNDPISLWRLGRDLWRLPSAIWHTYKVIQAQQPALVHLNSLTLVPSAIGAKLTGVPLIWHVRETVHDGHLGVRKRLLRWLVGILPDEVIYISQDAQDRLARRRRGTVIYNFIDMQRFDRHLDRTAVREELGIPRAALVALFLGGASPIKGAWPLAQALPLIRQRVPAFVCIVAGHTAVGNPRSLGGLWRRWRARVGRPVEVQRVQAALAAQAREGTARLVGFRTDVERLLAASDVLLFPATMPHFPRPIIEAGAMAKPVVASRLGGVEEVVQHGRTGLLVPPNDPAALAEAVVRILTDETLAAEMGEQGYEQARRLFDARTNAAQTVAVYERLLGEAG